MSVLAKQDYDRFVTEANDFRFGKLLTHHQAMHIIEVVAKKRKL